MVGKGRTDTCLRGDDASSPCGGEVAWEGQGEKKESNKNVLQRPLGAPDLATIKHYVHASSMHFFGRGGGRTGEARRGKRKKQKCTTTPF